MLRKRIVKTSKRSNLPKRKPVSKRKKQLYAIPKRMLNLIAENKKIDFQTFKSFSRLDAVRTGKLWKKYNPNRVVVGTKPPHPLIVLSLANLIFLRKDLSIREISVQVNKILAKCNLSTGIHESSAYGVNRFLSIRTFDETSRRGRLGGGRIPTSHVQKTFVLQLFDGNPRIGVREISAISGVGKLKVYDILEAAGRIRLNSRGPRKSLSAEQIAEVYRLIRQGKTNNEIMGVIGIKNPSQVSYRRKLLREQAEQKQ